MDYQKVLIKLWVSENGFDTKTEVIARIECEDIDAQKELEKCREAAIRSLWFEWGGGNGYGSMANHQGFFG